MSEEMKKVGAKVELTDDELDLVAGGVYSQEEWFAMTKEERRAAQLRSLNAKAAGQPCELD